MRWTSLLAVCLLLFTSSGCLEIFEKMTLERDGSGTYTMTFDMSKLFSDPSLSQFFNQAMEEGGETDFKFFGEAGEGPIDTILQITDLLEGKNVRFSHPEVMERSRMRMIMDQDQDTLAFSMELDFKDVSEIEKFFQGLMEMSDEEDQADILSPTSNFIPAGSAFSLSGRTLSRAIAPKSEEPGLNGEDQAMAELFLAAATYTAEFHFPGRVKKTNMPNAVIDGKTVIVSVPVMDILSGRANLSGDIKFKKR